MRISAIFLAGLTAAMATPAPMGSIVQERQTALDTVNDVKTGSCKDVTFIMARGSTETGNMGSIAGVPTCSALKLQMAGKVACQGVGSEDGYAAALPPNFQPKNTDDKSIAAAKKIITMAASKCPKTVLVLGGYSQGSAVMDNVMQVLPADTKKRVAGVVLFGFTRNAQDKAQIPGYPKDQTKIFCAVGDLVCDNTLTITAAHLTYTINTGDAAKFLASMAQSGASGASTKKAIREDAAAAMEQEFAQAKHEMKI